MLVFPSGVAVLPCAGAWVPDDGGVGFVDPVVTVNA